MPEGTISRKRGSDPQHSSGSASNPAKYLLISSSLQEGNSGKPALPLKVTIMAFGWFVPVLWVITDNSADGNLIIQASLPHFVWVKSVFSSLWVQLMLTKPGAVCNHTSFPYHLLSSSDRKTLFFYYQVPSWYICPWDSPEVSIMPHCWNSHFSMSITYSSPFSTEFPNSISHIEDYFTSELASLYRMG